MRMDIAETKFRVPSLLWIPLLVCVVLLFFVDVFQIQYYSLTPTRTPLKDLLLDQRFLAGFAINTPGCRIPYMDPFDVHVRKFIKNLRRPKCNKGIPALFESNLTTISLVNSSISAYNITDINELKCCYKVFWRREPNKDENDDQITYSKTCVNFTESANINEEFIEVFCTYENVIVYKDMFAFVPLKFHQTKQSQPQPLSVLVIGLDAVSRLNLHRQMPTTVKYLHDIDAVELLGYNKVGDNTFPNLMPVLTGLTEKELEDSCWATSDSRFDNCSFIWKDYKDQGYVTVYGEDASWMGVFNYQRKGFKKQSTDYAYNYFNRKAEKEIGNSHNMNVEECESSRDIYKDLLDYIKKFTVTMQRNGMPYFGFFWGASLSHDYLNKPKLGDQYYYTFFKNLKDEGYLNNTALIFMSDHGIRWGDIRQTYQGRMEERLPFVIIILPDWYKESQATAYRNLQKNTRRLTTPFDLHETLKDLLHPYNLTDRYLDKRNFSRGYSLFTEITNKRTCEDAAIDSHWCTCQQSSELDKNSTVAVQTATFAVEYINEELEGYAQCANLSLDDVLDARLMSHDADIAVDNKIEDYMITLRTVPGGGIFEVTVRRSKKGKFDIMGTISRLNLYGTQSSCITDYHLKLYCYCKSLL